MDDKPKKKRKPKEVSFDQIKIQDGKYNFLDVCRYLKTTRITTIGDYLGLECRSLTENGKHASVEKIAKTYWITKEQFEKIEELLNKYKNYYTVNDLIKKFNVNQCKIEITFKDYIEIDELRGVKVISSNVVENIIKPFLENSIFNNIEEFNEWNKPETLNEEDFIDFTNYKKENNLNMTLETFRGCVVRCGFYCFSNITHKNKVRFYFLKNDLEQIEYCLKNYIHNPSWKELQRKFKINFKLSTDIVETFMSDKLGCLNNKGYLSFNTSMVNEYYENLTNFKDVDFIIKSETTTIVIIYPAPLCNILLDKYKDNEDVFECIKKFPNDVDGIQIFDFTNYDEGQINHFDRLKQIEQNKKKKEIETIEKLKNDEIKKIEKEQIVQEKLLKKQQLQKEIDERKRIRQEKLEEERKQKAIKKEELRLQKKIEKEKLIENNKNTNVDISPNFTKINEYEFLKDGVIYYKETGPLVINNKYLTKRKIEKYFKDKFHYFGNLYLNKEELENIIYKYEHSITLTNILEECLKELNITRNDIPASKKPFGIKKLFPDKTCDYFKVAGFKNEVVYFYQTNDEVKEFEEIKEKVIEEYLYSQMTVDKIFLNYKIKSLNKKYKYENIKIYNEFLDTFDDTMSSKFSTKTILSLLNNIIDVFGNENINNQSTNDILDLNNSIEKGIEKELLRKFVEYLRINYETNIDTYSLVQYRKSTDEEKIFSKEEWENLIIHLASIDKHIEKAFEDNEYSQMWLLSLISVSMAWRISDINNLPKMDFYDVSKFNLNWFKENDFTIGMAQEIINIYTDYANRTLIEKTKEQKHFIIPNAIALPTAIALIIMEKHSQKKLERTNIFGSDIKRYSYIKENFYNQETINISNFTLLKANRSFITYGNEYAAHSIKFSYGGYALLSISRGHKLNESYTSNATSIYINSTDTDGNINDISLGMFNRGIFGWLYYSLIKMTTNIDKMQFCDINYIIDSMKKEFGAIGIENISNWINNEALLRQNILKHIADMPNDDIKDLLKKIQEKNNFSKKENILCSIFDISDSCSITTCVNPLIKDCTMCQYSIPTTYSLSVISNTLISLLEKMNNEENQLQQKIYANYVLKLLSIVGQAKLAFKDFGDDFINSYIQINEIKSLIQKNNLLKGD